MSVITSQNITQAFLQELSAHSPKASFTPFEKIAVALKYLEEKGIPNAKNEEYKYCNTEAILRREFKTLTSSFLPVPRKDLKRLAADKKTIYVFVVNGKPELHTLQKLPKGLTILSMEEAALAYPGQFKTHFGSIAGENTDAFIALNTAYAGQGLFIHVAKKAVIEQPLHIIYADNAGGNVALNFRNLVVVEEEARLNLTETCETPGLSANLFSNHLAEVFAAAGSVVDHTLIQAGGRRFFGVNTIRVSQQERSHYHINTFVFGGALVRNNLNIVVNGEQAETLLNGLSLTNDDQQVDNHTVVDHAKPNCNSSELYKGVASGKSTLTFNGKIFVRRDAQKINAYQSSKNILLSDDATINTKPQLEIFANDVKCSHGTSTGKVEEEALFYLRSRGIGEDSARKLLLHAFAGEVVQKVKNETLRASIEERLSKALNF